MPLFTLAPIQGQQLIIHLLFVAKIASSAFVCTLGHQLEFVNKSPSRVVASESLEKEESGTFTVEQFRLTLVKIMFLLIII